MKICLINPVFPDTIWGFEGIDAITGVKSAQAPLGLATVAALTPPGIEVGIIDENIEPIDFEVDADVIGLSAFNVQFDRAVEIAQAFRARGKTVVLGGPYVSLVPDKCRPHFDVLFVGEAEHTWPQFCRDYQAGQHQALYEQHEKVDMRHSPVPRFDLLKADKYLYFFVQTTRGCPFKCEFCDIIITDGRIPRTKPAEQVLQEIAAIHQLGVDYVAFSDANLIGNIPYAKALLGKLREFGQRHRFPMRFSAEMTVNVARDEKLLRLLRESNFESVFIGIESPRQASLLEAEKIQNTARSLLESVRKIQSYNLIIIAGMIVGFDHDDTAIFQEQHDFLAEAGIAFTTAGVLHAIERTPLHARLQAEGRLLEMAEGSDTTALGHGAADLNFQPAGMSRDDLLRGYNWLIRRLYSYQAYSQRLVQALRHFTRQPAPGPLGTMRLSWKTFQIVLRALRYFL
ncbi:MAG: radical SAM protein, partial [Deinococcus sp.]|nr:radical SAM protein [Deinococcus sp.]